MNRRHVILAAALGVLLAVSPGRCDDSSLTARELFGRMHSHAILPFDSAIGGYVVRIYNHIEGSHESTLANARASFEGAMKIRMANERALGRPVDEEAMKERLERDYADFAASLQKDRLVTIAVRYTQQGDNYRIEQFDLDNETALEELADDLANGVIPFESRYTRTWNGAEYAEINQQPTASADEQNSTRPLAAASYEDRASNETRFTSYARNAARDLQTLEPLLQQGLPSTVEAVMLPEGEKALRLQIGDPESVSLYFDSVVLPSRSYCVKSSSLRLNGAIMSREEHDGFVSTSAGFWLPTRGFTEAYRLDQRQVPYLSSKEEYVAFDPPETNVAVPAGSFDLAETTEFRAAAQSTHLLPQPALISRTELPPQSKGGIRNLLFALNLLVVVAGGVYWFLQKAKPRTG